eukprot:TRINITY_DN2730_c0_g1_i2.p1 TRINITY_DN2730_c0_g1~~TRINITY_DN2730_c0_g1_i2.p1  ORF type:complete len:174 (+),score=57.31 TRINITY_DN2730_c0_g1_i2:99-620(+)
MGKHYKSKTSCLLMEHAEEPPKEVTSAEIVEAVNEEETKGEESGNPVALNVRPLFVGKPKSGMPWRVGSSKSSKCLTRENPPLRMTFEERMRKKAELKAVQDKVNNLKGEKRRREEQRRAALKEKKKQKALNELKNSSFQVIKNSQKIRKWDRKARSQLAKLPPELFSKVLER